MTFVEAANACVCDSDAIAVAGGCQPCAADEVPTAGKCTCPAGKSKNTANVCETIAGLGDACDTASAPCADATYSYCATGGSGTAGTCTNECAASAECGAAYTCATWEANPYCRTFAGVGDPCGSNADCTGDANLCDTQQTHTCVIQGCSLTDNDCPRDLTCTDYSSFGIGTLCAGASS